jgi:ABC-type branched-subunit amino acid transport system ATPase component
MPNAIAIDDLTKVFRDINALNGLYMAVSEGSIFGLVGPNGAGKTTAIKIVMNAGTVATLPEAPFVQSATSPRIKSFQNGCASQIFSLTQWESNFSKLKGRSSSSFGRIKRPRARFVR